MGGRYPWEVRAPAWTFHVKQNVMNRTGKQTPIREGWMNDDASVQVPHLRRAPRL